MTIDAVLEARGVQKSFTQGPVTLEVLQGVMLAVSAGERIAIVGASGSGKSTIAALLQRLYEPDSGSISIGAKDIRSTDVTHLREHVAVVSQNPNLFDATTNGFEIEEFAFPPYEF